MADGPMSTPRRAPPRSIGTPTMSTAFTMPSPSRCRHLRGRLEDREDRPFRRELVADVRGHLDTREPAAHLRERRGEAAGVARPHDALELHLLDPGEEPDPL